MSQDNRQLRVCWLCQGHFSGINSGSGEVHHNSTIQATNELRDQKKRGQNQHLQTGFEGGAPLGDNQRPQLGPRPTTEAVEQPVERRSKKTQSKSKQWKYGATNNMPWDVPRRSGATTNALNSATGSRAWLSSSRLRKAITRRNLWKTQSKDTFVSTFADVPRTSGPTWPPQAPSTQLLLERLGS